MTYLDICCCVVSIFENTKQSTKRIGIESDKVCKQVRDQIVWKQAEDTAQGLL